MTIISENGIIGGEFSQLAWIIEPRLVQMLNQPTWNQVNRQADQKMSKRVDIFLLDCAY